MNREHFTQNEHQYNVTKFAQHLGTSNGSQTHSAVGLSCSTQPGGFLHVVGVREAFRRKAFPFAERLCQEKGFAPLVADLLYLPALKATGFLGGF